MHKIYIFDMLILKKDFSKFKHFFTHVMQPHLFYKSIQTIYDTRQHFTLHQRTLCQDQIKNIPKALANFNDINMIIDIHRKLQILQLNTQLTQEIICQKALAIHNKQPKLASLKFLTRNFSAYLDCSLLIQKMMVELMRTIQMPVTNNSYKDSLLAMSLIKQISDSKNEKVLKEIQQLILRNQLNYLNQSSYLLSEIALNLQICQSDLYERLFMYFMDKQVYEYQQYHRLLAVVNEQQDIIYQANTWAEIINLYVRANQDQRKSLISVIDRKSQSTVIPISSCLILLQSIKHDFQRPLQLRIFQEYSFLDINGNYFITSYYVRRLQKANSSIKDKIPRQVLSKLIKFLRQMRGLWKVQDQMKQIQRNQ